RPALGCADALPGRTADVLVPLAAAAALCRAGRPFCGDLLLGLVFYDARFGGKRPARSDERDDRQFRVPHRSVWSHSERQSHVLRESLAAAVLCRDGGARSEARGRGRLRAAAAAAAAQVRILDG